MSGNMRLRGLYWKKVGGKAGAGEDVYIRILGKENVALGELLALQSRIGQVYVYWDDAK
jgi:hypothetical protein